MPPQELFSPQTSIPLHKIKIVLLENIHQRAVDLLEGAGFTVELHKGAAVDQELIDLASDAHMIGIRSKTQLTPEFFEACPKLWCVGCFCIGTNQVDLSAAAERGVAVFNAPFSNTRSVAEKVICEVIALHRRLFERSAAVHAGKWQKSASGSHEVRGRTLGIVGYGRIGSQVSVLAEAMGMRVLYYDTSNTLPLGNAVRTDSLDELLAQSDCVTLHVPDVATTRNLIGERELSIMKPGAYLINNARGTVIDLHALRAAIESGRLGGAAVDVFPEEPKSNDAPFVSPLAGLPNVILTPHIGGSTVEAQENIAIEVGTKLLRLMNEGATATAVNVPEVDLPSLHADHHRIVHFHRNEPGVLGALHSVFASRGVNIAASYLQSDQHHGYAVLDIRPNESVKESGLLEELRTISGTIRVRTIW
ncbi:MAG: phosphoglycerate dehydrogenase [Phycisphaerales bacterium JB065]